MNSTSRSSAMTPPRPRLGSHVRKRRIALIAGILAGLVTLGACSGGGDPTGVSPHGGQGNASAANTAFRWWRPAWGSSVPYNPYAPGYEADALGPVLLPLAYTLPAPDKFGSYFPELASSWNLTSDSVVLHLRKNAKWHDGTAFTSKDVVTSLLLSGSELNQVWALVSGVTAPDASTVVLHISKGNSPALALDNAMGIAILPNSQYGSLVPASFEQDLVKYWTLYNPVHATDASIGAANSSPSYTNISKVGGALVKFNPKKMIGDGPFTLVKITNAQILLKKWDGFWDASKVTAPWVEVSAMNDSTGTGALLGSQMDFDDTTQLTTPVVERLKRTSNLHYNVIPTNVQQEGLQFNYTHYPFNLTAVRQAIAHLIDRKKIVELDVGGTPAQNTAVEYPAGIHEVIGKQYLTKQQMSSLDPYNLDPDKAASLLQGAGFTKKGGKWYTPKGDQFKMTINTLSGYSLFETDANVIAQSLKSAGIDASVTAVPSPAYGQRQGTGQYGVSINWVDYGSSNPLTYFNTTLSSFNFPATWNGQGTCKTGGKTCQPAIGVGPFGDVPGLGKVNLSQTINHQVFTVPPGSDWNTLTWSWAQFVNKELPILPVQNNAIHEAYSTSRYTNWPADSSKLWTLYGGGRQMLYFMQNGFLQLKTK